MTEPHPATAPQPGVRIDIWLWAARFFKTRSLAKHAIETGKVEVDGFARCPSRAVLRWSHRRCMPNRRHRANAAPTNVRRAPPNAPAIARRKPNPTSARGA